MHTVVEIGFWRNPKIMAFSQKVKNRDAGAWIIRLREFILTDGTDDGRLPGFSPEEIAAVMQPSCSVKLLFQAMAKYDILKRLKRSWIAPGWKKSAMGRYCEIREWARERKREWREAQAAAALATVSNGESASGDVHVTGADVPGTSQRHSRSINKGRHRDVPPEAPPKGGSVADALTRWGWFESIHPRIRSPERCKRLLQALTPEEYTHLQFSLPKQASSSLWNKNMRFVPWADKYLERKQFLEIRLSKPEKFKPSDRKNRPKSDGQSQEAEKLVSATRYLLEQLADSGIDSRKKDRLKLDFEKNFPGKRPWEAPASPPTVKPHHDLKQPPKNGARK